MRASDFISTLGDSLKAFVKIVLCSRNVHSPRKDANDGRELVILANGPSLNKTIAEHSAKLHEMPTLAVNFMANAPQFRELKPNYYVLADSHFFEVLEHENVSELWKNIASVDWTMTLCVPATRRKLACELLADSNVKIVTYNFVGIEGFAWLENFAFSHALAMPRPRNVLIPALMVAINAGFDTIYISGADHSWMETLRVTDDNRVVSVQPHFYADSTAEQLRSATEYKGYRLHDILNSFYVAFRSYHRLQRFAKAKGVVIYNSTPGSYIDAFERREL